MKKIVLSFLSLFLLFTLEQARSLQSGATVSGAVLEEGTDRPLPDVDVILNPESPGPLPFLSANSELKSITTDSEGRFTIEGIPAGRYRLIPERDGWVFAMPSHLSAPREPGVWVQLSAADAAKDIKIRMQREAVITGRVLDENGQPAPGSQAAVDLMRYRYDEFGKRRLAWVPGIHYPRAAGSFVRMDDQGEYRFYGLPPGDYYLLTSGGFRGGSPPRLPVPVYYPGTIDEAKAEPIHVEAGQEIRLNTLTLQSVRGANIHLKFSDPSGNPGLGRIVQFNGGLILGLLGPEKTIPVVPGHYDFFVSAATSTGRASLDVGTEDVAREIVMTRGVHVTVKFQIEDEAGKDGAFRPEFRTFRCGLRSQTTPFNPQCVTGRAGTYIGTIGSLLNSEPPTVPPDVYRLEFPMLPPDVFPLTATISGRDVLHAPFSIDGETEVEVTLSRAAGVITGTARDSNGEKLPDAVVSLLPEEPYRIDRYLTHSVIADRNGKFEIRGIAPGTYRLYAWPELEGPAFLNSEFMAPFNERGKRVEIQKGARLSTDITAF